MVSKCDKTRCKTCSHVDEGNTFVTPSSQGLAAGCWENQCRNSTDVYPSLLELLAIIMLHECTVDLLNSHAGEGIVYFNNFIMPADGTPFFNYVYCLCTLNASDGISLFNPFKTLLTIDGTTLFIIFNGQQMSIVVWYVHVCILYENLRRTLFLDSYMT